MSKKYDDTLAQLQTALADELLKRVMNGEATAAELNVARQLLRDNNVQALPEANPGLDGLRLVLPFPEAEAG